MKCDISLARLASEKKLQSNLLDSSLLAHQHVQSANSLKAAQAVAGKRVLTKKRLSCQGVSFVGAPPSANQQQSNLHGLVT